MVKRPARGKQQPRSKKVNRNSEGSRKDDDIDWNISSDEAEGEENFDFRSASEHSEEEVNPEDLETVEERKLRLAKEYLAKVRLEEEERYSEDDSELSETDDEGVEERIEKRLQREADEARGRVFKEVASQLKDKELAEGRFCKGHLMPVTCTDISGDERFVVSGGKDCKACLWDVESGKVITIFEGKRESIDSPKRKELNCHRGEILAVQMSYDGKYVVTAGREGLIRIWDSRVGTVIGEDNATSIVAAATKANGRHITHMTDCKDILRGHRGLITSLLLQRDNVLYSGGLDNTIKLWNIVDTTYVDTLYGHDTLITAISGQRNSLSTHNNTRILSSSTDNTLRLWKIEANTQMVYRGRRSDVSMECATMVSQTHFVTGDMNGSLNVFAADKKKSIYSVKLAHGEDNASTATSSSSPSGKWIVSLASLPYTNVVASGSFSDCVRLWDLNPSNREKDGELLKPVATVPVNGFVNSISFANSGKFMVMGVGQEHRMGRWWRLKGVKNGIYIQKLDLDLSV